MSEALNNYLAVWQSKPVLREVYGDFFRRIADKAVAGPTLELGGGIGNLREYLPDVISSDIQFGPWLNVVADAQRLPFAAASLGNIVMLDVLHHIEHPLGFFDEAARVLRPGGRIVTVEPAITALSWFFYNFIHEEPVVLSADPLTRGAPDPKRNPYDSNQAIPTLIATRHRARFEMLAPQLRIAASEWFSFLAYPLSGGFKRWSLLTAAGAKRMIAAERRLEPLLGRFAGFRILTVYERRAAA